MSYYGFSCRSVVFYMLFRSAWSLLYYKGFFGHERDEWVMRQAIAFGRIGYIGHEHFQLLDSKYEELDIIKPCFDHVYLIHCE